MRWSVPLAPVLLLLASATACQAPAGQDGGAAVTVPFAGCAVLARPPQAASAPAGTGAGREGTALPALSLPCYADGDPVAVASLRGPAVVNIWASWCGPCRRELPVLQDFADRNRGKVHVLGVVSGDSRSASVSLATDLGVSFPQLIDDEGRLMRALGRTGLPVTLFVDARGQIASVYHAEALDRDALDRLAGRHLEAVPA